MVEVSQLATHCLPAMYERKQLKMGGGGSKFLFLKIAIGVWPIVCFTYKKKASFVIKSVVG